MKPTEAQRRRRIEERRRRGGAGGQRTGERVHVRWWHLE